MVKVRMNTADVAAEVKCLRHLIGMRCSNVYDLSAKVFSYYFACMIIRCFGAYYSVICVFRRFMLFLE